MHGIYYVLFILQFLFFSSFFIFFLPFKHNPSNIHSNPCYHWARTYQIQSKQLMGSVQEVYVNIDAVPKRSWVGNMMKTATYYSVLVQSLSVAVRYRRR
ncbi:hypothetical protein BDV24DRAFT_134940 [Aspergillus arachidicola]|uniref:Uncharacterized protein n=1 Tax=Aspergillus arachidicola TaxID=656916 RepID=A0A5N6Y6A9_9EURO|nr:hypothetical protein BDV24DRAFT_134940 [Aspergillus arachidicola]